MQTGEVDVSWLEVPTALFFFGEFLGRSWRKTSPHQTSRHWAKLNPALSSPRLPKQPG